MVSEEGPQGNHWLRGLLPSNFPLSAWRDFNEYAESLA
jgi:hypothetical protein